MFKEADSSVERTPYKRWNNFRDGHEECKKLAKIFTVATGAFTVLAFSFLAAAVVVFCWPAALLATSCILLPLVIGLANECRKMEKEGDMYYTPKGLDEIKTKIRESKTLYDLQQQDVWMDDCKNHGIISINEYNLILNCDGKGQWLQVKKELKLPEAPTINIKRALSN